ncbi:MAG: FAD-binding domain-containing protein [Pseudomonadota bacterium]
MDAVTVLWLKRDLRIVDHPALTRAAAAEEPVLPLYIVEPGLWAGTDASDRQWQFVSDALCSLRSDLAGLGAPLLIRVGSAVEVFEAIRSERGIARIVSHQETGTLWTYDRDRDVARWARDAGIPWEEVPQSGVVRRLASRDGWARARDSFVFSAMAPRPHVLRAAQWCDPGKIPSAASLGLVPCGIRERQKGRREDGETLLSSFLATRGQSYRSAMSSPLTGETACSRLSPHLAWGTLSIREVAHATQARQRDVRGTRSGWVGSLKSAQARFAWRDHFTQKLEDAPDMEVRELHSAFQGLRGDDRVKRAAWEAGETGIPFVDANMRYLHATGWLNFRMRAMLVSFASYHLWLDWRATGPHLARLFTDYDPGIHWPQLQMQAGVTGINTPRIYNPVKQGRDQDPDGVFTRTWLPELADVPDRFLQEPWRWEGAARLIYPGPVIDLAQAGRDARSRIWAVRKTQGFREEASRIVRQHASRKDPRFVNDRAPRPRKQSKQLSLGL